MGWASFILAHQLCAVVKQTLIKLIKCATRAVLDPRFICIMSAFEQWILMETQFSYVMVVKGWWSSWWSNTHKHIQSSYCVKLNERENLISTFFTLKKMCDCAMFSMDSWSIDAKSSWLTVIWLPHRKCHMLVRIREVKENSPKLVVWTGRFNR